MKTRIIKHTKYGMSYYTIQVKKFLIWRDYKDIYGNVWYDGHLEVARDKVQRLGIKEQIEIVE